MDHVPHNQSALRRKRWLEEANKQYTELQLAVINPEIGGANGLWDCWSYLWVYVIPPFEWFHARSRSPVHVVAGGGVADTPCPVINLDELFAVRTPLFVVLNKIILCLSWKKSSHPSANPPEVNVFCISRIIIVQYFTMLYPLTCIALYPASAHGGRTYWGPFRTVFRT